MKNENLRELLVEELKDLYSAENQLTKALPKVAKNSSDPQLKKAIESHLKETEGHVARLEKIFEKLDESPKGKTCEGMKGLITEADERIKEGGEPSVLDAGLIADAQRVDPIGFREPSANERSWRRSKRRLRSEWRAARSGARRTGRANYAHSGRARAGVPIASPRKAA